MESSDDSFAWMSTSSDSNDSNSEYNKMSAVKTKSEEGDSTDDKKTVHKRVFDGERPASGGEHEPPPERRKPRRERAAAAAAARVKREAASGSDSDSASAELARRVNEELAADPPHTNGRPATSDTDAFVSTDKKSKKKKSKKRKKETSFSDSDSAELARRVKQELAAAPGRAGGGPAASNVDTFVSPDRKSEKKSRKRKKETSPSTDIKDMIVEDSFSAEETVVESRSRPRKLSNSLTQSNHHTDGDDNASTKIKIYASREFVSDCSSDENSTKKKKKHKNKSRHSEIENERQKSSDSDERRTEATPGKSIESAQHKQKISDRITFEDEDDLQIENNYHLTNGQLEQQGTQSTRLKRFLKSNPQLKPETLCFDGDSAVTRDDEVWVLRCPCDLDISNLKGKDLHLDTKCKLKIDGQAYDGSLNEEKGTVAMLSCQSNQIIINNASLIGTANFRKRIPKPHFVEDNVIVNNQTNFIPLPETKCRHPLFGSDYKKAMKIPSAIKARLKGKHEPKLEQAEKTKKKNKHSEQEYEEETAAAAAAPAPASQRQRRRRAAPAGREGDAPPHKKTKTIKKEVSADTWDSVKAIEESLFDF